MYVDGIDRVKAIGYSVQAIVADGRQGIYNAFKNTPVQLCQFHQVKTVTKYLTKNPKLEASMELRNLSLQLKNSDKAGFVRALNEWYAKWEKTINQRTTFVEDGKVRSSYTHINLRKAYRSPHTNIPHLFIFKECMKFGIPNTTNRLDGHFSDLKNKLRNHNGMSRRRKMKMMLEHFNS